MSKNLTRRETIRSDRERMLSEGMRLARARIAALPTIFGLNDLQSILIFFKHFKLKLVRPSGLSSRIYIHILT